MIFLNNDTCRKSKQKPRVEDRTIFRETHIMDIKSTVPYFLSNFNAKCHADYYRFDVKTFRLCQRVEAIITMVDNIEKPNHNANQYFATRSYAPRPNRISAKCDFGYILHSSVRIPAFAWSPLWQTNAATGLPLNKKKPQKTILKLTGTAHGSTKERTFPFGALHTEDLIFDVNMDDLRQIEAYIHVNKIRSVPNN